MGDYISAFSEEDTGDDIINIEGPYIDKDGVNKHSTQGYLSLRTVCLCRDHF